VDKGSGPLDQRSTKQLKSDLARSELAPRKKSFVQEILRRRREAKAGDRSRKYVWLGRNNHSIWPRRSGAKTIGQPGLGADQARAGWGRIGYSVVGYSAERPDVRFGSVADITTTHRVGPLSAKTRHSHRYEPRP
jgi:hypothetical protein